ncbi:ABC transporter ATP-binding protein [Rothia dentocariosa]|uniref:ABC transporter ATP-binding protein n=1 Tax=Rothia dentocariosa TaxID=2047 RepID=UPI000E08512B|nr:ABC transporter ATP-binding protein [Rothia dentocariosa]SUE45169.1 Uncharacterized ABC transporter ATP-binding protein YbhF [Rothia dentocariosa]
MNTTTVIQAENLTQVFRVPGGTLTAVDNLDLTISKGEIIALLGPNGAGKTTLIDMILGLTEPARGTLTVQGISPKKAVQRGDIGAVLQTGGLLKDLTVRQTLEMLATLYPTRIDIDKVLASADLTELAHRKVGKCSGGQQQRIRFAIATMHDPNILILDEPTTGMDVTARRTFWERMDKLAETGKTIIFATHYLEEAQNFAQRIVLMRDGAIIADGTSEEIRDLTGYRHVSFLADAPLAFDDLPHQQVEITQENGKYRHRLNISDAEDFVRLLLNTQVVSDLEIVKPSMDESSCSSPQTPNQPHLAPQRSPRHATLHTLRNSPVGIVAVFRVLHNHPACGLYMLFGALQDYAKVKVADGNASAYVMIGMALYGAISSTVSVSGLTVVENVAGWGRQLALTPMNTGKYLFSKCCVAFVMAAVPVKQ